MTDVFKIKKKLKKKVRALEKKIKNIEIAESLKKKRKLSPGSDGGGKKEEKKNGENCFYPSKFAAIKRDFRLIIKDKRDLYNTFFIRLSLLERWADETIMQNDDNILQFRMCSQHAKQLTYLYNFKISGKEDY
jgi:hypothetical protein